jgi:RHS repeat-associated protein
LPAALSSATYDDANQIATWGGTSFSYDSNGNLTSDGTRTYTWNARNELTGISGPVSASFAYDGLGRRRAKTVSGATTQFLYDGLNPVQELASGTPTANTLTGLAIDEYFRRIDSSTTRYYLADALQSSIALADGLGALQTSYTYEPFGGLSTSGGATTNTHAYAGREADGTGLFHYRARYYDPRLQRFIAEDPIGIKGDVNLHRYVRNDPVLYRDPLGLIVFIGGAGVSGVRRPGGGEVSAGIAFTPSACAGVASGGFLSGGLGVGQNVSADLFGGFIFGGYSNLAGTTKNFNLGLGVVSITAFFDPNSMSFLGGTVGVGPSTLPLGASVTWAHTVTSSPTPDCSEPDPLEPPDDSSGGGSGSSGGAAGSAPRLGGRKGA